MLTYIFIVFFTVVSIQGIYYFVFLGSISKTKLNKSYKNFNKPVSVLICSKNEAENLKKLLPRFQNQTYKDFQLVLINDCSTDETIDIIKDFKENSLLNIKIVDIKPVEHFWGNKKYALTLGIKAAAHEHLLFTDADCTPISENWIETMVSNFTNKKQIVLGYSAYEKVKNSFLNKIIRFETLITAIQYFSYAKIGVPYMGVGRNLAYTKSLFFKVNGFINHMNIKSGDDDLFINSVATSKNTAICLSKDGFTQSVSKKSFKKWFQQKRRHVSTAKHYKSLHKFLLGLFYISQIGFWILAIFLLIFQYNWQLTAGLIAFRFLVLYVTLAVLAKKLNEKDLVVFFPVFEVFLILSQFIIFIKNLISKPTHW
jgi:glycosyltransferase involved in cell wall biosynthesis